MDISSSGPRFPWSNGRQGSTNVQKQLNRGDRFSLKVWSKISFVRILIILPLLIHLHGNLTTTPWINRLDLRLLGSLIRPLKRLWLKIGMGGTYLTKLIIFLKLPLSGTKMSSVIFSKKEKWTPARICWESALNLAFSEEVYNFFALRMLSGFHGGFWKSRPYGF